VRALEAVCENGDCDLIIIGRGGGSLEDLQAFNTEEVARAVYECPLPVVSAVGHEVDISLCDLVADVRAATPSEAAEMCVPDMARLRVALARMERNLAHALSGIVREARLRLRNLQTSRMLRRPEEILQTRRQMLDELLARLNDGVAQNMQTRRNELALSAARLEGLSPLGVLARGFSVTRRENGVVVTDADTVAADERLKINLARGVLRVRVEETETGGQVPG
jgi:exodeoxyribonuclease VII large subunit